MTEPLSARNEDLFSQRYRDSMLTKNWKKSVVFIAHARSIALHIPVSAYHQAIGSCIARIAMLTGGGGTRAELLPRFLLHESDFHDSDVGDSDRVNHL